MAQVEFLPRIKKIKNFFDRISLKYIINPLDENETSQMISFRLKQAGYNQDYELFTPEAVRLIHAHTQGYPRKISMICHDALEYLVMRDLRLIDDNLIGELITESVR